MHVITTAGHVDHGKSTLVRALTGMEPDRWAEERRRGMTIDLGFAWTTLGSGEDLAFVDVPGHERFLTNMLAGVGPVPAVMFVVAADEGWMPQSQEHLDALDALRVRHGLLVVTRSDLADPGPATESSLARIGETSLGEVDAVAVSGTTGSGLEVLTTALKRLADSLPAPDHEAPVRLWIDRVFTVKGSGTVVTGTLAAGTIRVGDELELAPDGRRVRVRALETLRHQVPVAAAVARVAVNLRGIDHTVISRGMALVTPGGWTTASQIDVRLDPDDDADTLPGQLLLHIGTTRVQAGLRLLSEPSQGAVIARLTLLSPSPLHVGDRVLLRHSDASITGQHIVGATVLDVRPPVLRRRGSAAQRGTTLSALADATDGAFHLRQHGVLPVEALPAMGCSVPTATRVADWLVDPDYWDELRQRLGEAVDRHAADDLLQPGLAAEAARRLLNLPDRRLVDALVRPPLRIADGRIHRGDAAPRLPEPVQAAVSRLSTELTQHPYQAPTADHLVQLGLDRKALGAAVKAGALLRIAEGIVLLPGADSEAARILSGLPQPFTASQAKEALDTTRRVVIPLLEHLERTRRTERVAERQHRCRPAPDTAA